MVDISNQEYGCLKEVKRFWIGNSVLCLCERNGRNGRRYIKMLPQIPRVREGDNVVTDWLTLELLHKLADEYINELDMH